MIPHLVVCALVGEREGESHFLIPKQPWGPALPQ